LKQLRDVIHEKKKLNKPIDDDATTQRILKECHSLLENLAERAEERVQIVQVLLSDYRDEVYPSTPPHEVLASSITDLRSILQSKQLYPSSHSLQSNRATNAESSLLDLPCVLEDLELGKLKEMIKKKPKGGSVSVPEQKVENQGVEVVMDKVVKCISAILYVCQLPLEIFDSCFITEQDIPQNVVMTLLTDEQRLNTIAMNLMKLDTVVVEKKPKESIPIIKIMSSAVKEAVVACEPEMRPVFQKVQAACPEIIRLAKDAFLQLEKNNMSGFTMAQEQLSSIILDLQMVIGLAAKKRPEDMDMSFNLMEAADMVMKALVGLVSSEK